MNPYTSSGSVATMTANVSGNDNLTTWATVRATR